MKKLLIILAIILTLSANHNPVFAGYATPSSPPVPRTPAARSVPASIPPRTTPKSLTVENPGTETKENTPAVQVPTVKTYNTDYQPVITLSPIKPKTPNSETLDINVTGYREDRYSANEPITFSFSGISDKMTVNQENGFSAIAMLTDLSQNTGNSLEVQYNPVSRLWTVETVAPKVVADNHEIDLIIFCGNKDSLCAEVYGGTTQVDEQLPLLIH